MNLPRLSDLPPPPPGKTGFPWTEETLPLLDSLPDGALLSFNRLNPDYNGLRNTTAEH